LQAVDKDGAEVIIDSDLGKSIVEKYKNCLEKKSFSLMQSESEVLDAISCDGLSD
jgi:hypothetical protein